MHGFHEAMMREMGTNGWEDYEIDLLGGHRYLVGSVQREYAPESEPSLKQSAIRRQLQELREGTYARPSRDDGATDSVP